MAGVVTAHARALFDSLEPGGQAVSVWQFMTGVHPRPAIMHPAVVPVTLLAYLSVKRHLAHYCRRRGTTGRSLLFRFIALSHNLLLCLFSATSALNVWSIVETVYQTGGPDALYCSPAAWTAGLSRWSLLFYASKIWELVDTILLVWKNRTPSFLQVYHHAATLAIAYALHASNATATFLFIGLNAAVHTVMYAYYAATIIGVRVAPVKSAITTMQMVQFVVGIALAAPMFVLRRGDCAIGTQKIATGMCMAHAAFLLVLFARFYRRMYYPDDDDVRAMKQRNKAK